jgi:HlyD family secretion protein
MNDAPLDRREGRGGRARRVGVSLLVAVLAIGLLAASAYLIYPKARRSGPEYRTIAAGPATIRRTVIANGTISPRKEVNVKPQISGVIEKVLVSRGDIVRTGDLLAVIRPLPNPADVSAAEAEVDSANISHLHAEQEFRRIERLFRRDLVARSDYEKLETDLHLAEQRLAAARRRLEIVKTGASTALGRSASEVRATAAGTILERPIEVGAFVIESNTFNEGTTIVSIADMSDLVFRGKVDEPDAGSLRLDMPAAVAIGALPGERFQARLDFIAPKATEKDGVTTFEIRAALTLKPGRVVRAGYSATAEVVVAQRERVLALPERSVQFRQGRPFVAVETAPGVFQSRAVELGLSDGITTEVVGGLRAGERVRLD